MKKAINKQIKGYPVATIAEDRKNFYIDLNTGLGEGIYPKKDFTLDEAIYDTLHMFD